MPTRLNGMSTLSVQDEAVCKVGINGFGRIGRAAFRASMDRTDLEVVAINHTAPDLNYLLHVIRYDSTHGNCKYMKDISLTEDGNLLFKKRKIMLYSQRDPLKIDWASAGAEYIVESTGKFKTVETAAQHVTAGAKKVVISAPSKDAPTIVVGVNRRDYKTSMNVVSNASCTTNCLAPIAKILDDHFGIETGMMTTVHAFTSSQNILDGYSKKSKRLGRGVGNAIIPTTTGAATAVELVLPQLVGKFTGISVRVPVSNVSMVDLTVTLATPVKSKEELLAPFRDVANGTWVGRCGVLSHVINVVDEELISTDFLGWTQSCIIDAAATTMLNDRTFKVIAWNDNEFAYVCRLLDLAVYMHSVDNGHPSVAATPSASGRNSPVH